MTTALDPAELLRRLAGAGVDYVLIGGLAVNAHGVIRSTKDVDICPAPDRANLARLADLLGTLEVRQLGALEVKVIVRPGRDLCRGPWGETNQDDFPQLVRESLEQLKALTAA